MALTTLASRWLLAATAAVLVTMLVLAGCGGEAVTPTTTPRKTSRLTILHTNDANSQLLPTTIGGDEYGGAARFVTLVRKLSDEAEGQRSGVLLVSSGGNIKAGPAFNASIALNASPMFDAAALDSSDYDAIVLGNHEFDFGPDVLADFIKGFHPSLPFLSANIDVSGEPRLAALAAAGRIAKSTISRINGERIGIVGATTPRLPFVASPRNVTLDADVAGAVQREVDRLRAQGVNKVVLISHLEALNQELALAPKLRGVSVIVAGGGGEVLSNPGDLLVPGDEKLVAGPYPMRVKDADGRDTLVVTTPGNYRYVGRLVLDFDAAGQVANVLPTSGVVRVAGGSQPDAVAADTAIQAKVVEPVSLYIKGLATPIGRTEVALDSRTEAVRTRETALGDVVADALLWQATRRAAAFGAPTPQVAIENAGGIRGNTIIPAGPLRELDTFTIAPFANFIVVVPSVPAAQVKELLENAVSRVDTLDGRFAQVAGVSFTWDPKGTAQAVDAAGRVITPGTRIRDVRLKDGTVLVRDGGVVPDAPSVSIATNDFLANGGDQSPYRKAPFVSLGVTYQQALSTYLKEALGGTVSASAYPEAGQGRIQRVGG